jgi:hypothetical protein
VFWGAVLPLAGMLAGLMHPLGFALLLALPLQALRLIPRLGARLAFFTVLGKLPEAQGVIGYWWGRLRHRQAGLIEYK